MIYDGGTYTVYYHIVPNGKYYIGITSTKLNTRFGKNGYNYRNQLFGRAIKKYGWDNIESNIFITGVSKEIAESLEELLILHLDTTDKDKGYNVSIGGGSGPIGYKHTDDAKRRMSENRSGILNYGYGKPMSDEVKAKQRESHLGKYDGELNPSSILTEDDVLEIRRIYKFRDKIYGQKALSERYNIHNSTVSAIINRRTWTHI